MLLSFLIYVASLSSGFKAIAATFAGILGFLFLMSFLISLEDSDENNPSNLMKFIKMNKKWALVLVVSILSAILIPTREVAYVMIGAYVAQQLITNYDTNNTPTHERIDRVLNILEKNLIILPEEK